MLATALHSVSSRMGKSKKFEATISSNSRLWLRPSTNVWSESVRVKGGLVNDLANF